MKLCVKGHRAEKGNVITIFEGTTLAPDLPASRFALPQPTLFRGRTERSYWLERIFMSTELSALN